MTPDLANALADLVTMLTWVIGIGLALFLMRFFS